MTCEWCSSTEQECTLPNPKCQSYRNFEEKRLRNYMTWYLERFGLEETLDLLADMWWDMSKGSEAEHTTMARELAEELSKKIKE